MLAGVAIEITSVTIIVGTYLSYLLGIPLPVSLLGILLGSLVAIGLLGSLLLFALSRRNVTKMLELPAYGQEDKASGLT